MHCRQEDQCGEEERWWESGRVRSGKESVMWGSNISVGDESTEVGGLFHGGWGPWGIMLGERMKLHLGWMNVWWEGLC